MDANDLARIRYVTRHFQSLQGFGFVLSVAPCVVLLLLPTLLEEDARMPFHPLAVAVWLASIFFTQWAAFWTRDYYARQFGALRNEDQLERILPWALLGAAAVLADLLRLGTGGVSASLMVFASLGIWRAAQGWPWRAHQLLIAAVGVYGVLALPLPGPAEDPNSYIRLVTLLLVATTAVCGLLDHRLLVKTLRPHGRLPGEDVDSMEEATALDEARQ